MSDNLYRPAEEPRMSGLGGMLLPIGTELGHRWTTKTLNSGMRATRRTRDSTKLGAWWTRSRHANKEAGAIWKSFLTPDSAFEPGMGGRFNAARHAAAGQTYDKMATRRSFYRRTQRLRPLEKITKGFDRSNVGGLVKRAITKRTIAGLARVPLGVANTYFWVGQYLPAMAEAGMAGLSAMAKFGAKLRSGAPETSTRMVDMAVRTNAFTMRQASDAALHMSQMGVRSALGNEASHLHS